MIIMTGKALVRKPSNKELEKYNFDSWPIWEIEVSEYPWEYLDKETFYVIEGRATVILDDGEKIEFSKGNLVIFAKGIKCTWTVHEPIRKVYKFGEI